ncbi:MAG TPA: dCTP deaminase [Egibacteraceae bacterium]|jgi:dCTP deaminase|nr:dCTP deaminase [Egibacteraceae bacterium]
MILSDRSIREAIAAGRITVEPLSDNAIQPSSVDVRLDDRFRVFHNHRHPYIDVRQAMPDLTEEVKAGEDAPFILHPGEFVLAATFERIVLADDIVARIEGKSSLGRLGLLTHATAGFVDPGWDGWLTLELSNVSTLPIALYPGMKIGQIAFFELSTPADRPYGSDALGSKYQGQRGPTASKFFMNFPARE